ncbi:PAS domain S-box protein, partial [Desulfobacterales bacterium HSG16]|nr:PAS domain S-box protein [Desulfobacterales bacterium HSG16]
MNIFTLLTPMTYWLLIGMWSFILLFYIKRLRSEVMKDQLLFVLLVILAIDAFRTLFESFYFGAWYTSLAGLLPKGIYTFLVRPEMVFIPKIINVIAAIIVIVILLYRWLPKEELEKDRLEKLIQQRNMELIESNEQLQNEIIEREHAENALQKAHNELEIRVRERTAELASSNEILRREIIERKTTERVLKKRERQLTESQKAAMLGSWDLNLVSQELEWSEEAYKLFDKDPDTFLPSFDEFARLVHPDDFETMQNSFNNALKSDDTPYHVEVRIINDSGREWVMEAFGKVRRDNSGKALSIFGTAQNVTERSLAKALKNSEEKYRQLVELSPEPVFIHQKEKLAYVNPATIQFLKAEKAEDLIGRSIMEFVDADSLELIKQRIISVNQIEKAMPFIEAKMTRINGETAYIESSSVSCTYNGEKAILVVARDITEKKH